MILTLNINLNAMKPGYLKQYQKKKNQRYKVVSPNPAPNSNRSNQILPPPTPETPNPFGGGIFTSNISSAPATLPTTQRAISNTVFSA